MWEHVVCEYDGDRPAACVGANNSVICTFGVTVEDNENPAITGCPANITQDSDSGVCEAVVTWTAPTASDNCPGVTLTSTHNSGDTFPVGTTTVTYTATDAANNSVICTFDVTVEDNEDPVISDCPADITVDADAGRCTADVSWTPPTASDNCAIDTFVSTHDPGETFSGGTTTVTYTATDVNGNVETCSFDVTVSAFNELVIDLDLVDMGSSGTLTRCITFELFECGGGSAVVYEDITFTNGSASSVLVLVPCGLYECITVQNDLHTLRRTDDNTGSFVISGTQYTASFTGNAAASGLIGGDFYDDDFIDIIDFTVYVNRWGVAYDSDGDAIQDGDTPCSWTPTPQGPYHADMSGDGLVATADFTFVQTYFLFEADGNCCGLRGVMGGGNEPRISISVRELRELGLDTYADLNGDGWVDSLDVAAFANGDRPNIPKEWKGSIGPNTSVTGGP